ncbi:MAG TPA: methanogenesis marker 16 metalloprotein [Methanotrichaceae archaeon]|nr:methanogenesis marker 16 metalloprotein [Methanotrichaceae archaeon]
MVRSFLEISERVSRGEAVIMTTQEVCEISEGGERPDVDVVTTATRAIMSGTYAVFSFPVAGPHTFLRAKRAWMAGVPAQVGPCPNENLGILDLVVFGTAHSISRPGYGGGHLFRDLVEGRSIHVEVETDDGRRLSTEVRLGEMPHARLYGTRHCFKNYSAFVNPGGEPLATIFHATGFHTRLTGATFSGCGQINPLKNDPLMDAVGLGTKVLINGAEGFVTGTGTRSSPERPNLSGVADMHHMDPEYMGGFLTSAGPECICSWAVPIPVTSESILESIVRLDRDIPLSVMDVCTRQPISQSNYGQVWQNSDPEVVFSQEKCAGCVRCRVIEACPMGAVSYQGSSVRRDEKLCFHCGLCTTVCEGRAFQGSLGSICMDDGQKVPVVLRQSDRHRALRLAEELRDRIAGGSFKMTQMVERIC